jgi:hypothetical protein
MVRFLKQVRHRQYLGYGACQQRAGNVSGFHAFAAVGGNALKQRGQRDNSTAVEHLCPQCVQ